MEVGSIHPTIYLQNLNERVRPEDLKKALAALLEPCGRIVGIVAKRRLALRGQAWVQFESAEQARGAIAFLQGRRLYGKSVVVRFARYRSDAVAKAEGTFEADKHHRELEKQEKARYPRVTRRRMMQQMMANPAISGMGGMAGAMAVPMGMGSDMQIPHKILFLQALPPGVTERTINGLFQRFPGFNEVRAVPNRPDLAFVEFESEQHAAAAKHAMDRHDIEPGVPLRVSFARR